MRPATVELAGTTVSVVLHPTDAAAESHALNLALENTSGDKDQILTNFRACSDHAEGDYRVVLVNAQEAGIAGV